VTDFETVREAALQDEVKELEAEVEEKQAYCVWADKRIGDLEHEVERLQRMVKMNAGVAVRQAEKLARLERWGTVEEQDRLHREVERLTKDNEFLRAGERIVVCDAEAEHERLRAALKQIDMGAGYAYEDTEDERWSNVHYIARAALAKEDA